MSNTQANQEQRIYWNDQAGPRWVKLQQRLDAQIQPLGMAAIQRAEITAGEHVLDIGCGCGQTGLELAKHVGSQGSVLGIDLSLPMLERARERQRELGLTNIEFLQADAQTHKFEAPRFDLAFSRFGVMFFEDPTAAFRNIRSALRPHSRLCFVCWQGLEKNEWAKVPLTVATQHVALPPPAAPGTPGPFAFADQVRVRQILKDAGLVEVQFESYETQLNMGGASTVDDAVDFSLEIGPVAALLRDADTTVRSRVRRDLTFALLPFAKQGGVKLGGAVWIVRARSTR
jgi:SAM-dependent methyltransferase